MPSLDFLRRLREETGAGLPPPTDEAWEVEETRARLGAALIRSRFGEVWVAVDPCIRPELEAEEDKREEPRPILGPEDVARLRGRSDRTISATLAVLRRFPGARVTS